MRVLEIKNLIREEGQIFYIRKYACDVVLEGPTTTINTKILFTIETNPFSLKKIDIVFVQDLNYPILPVKKAIREYLLVEDNEGRIPC